MIRGLLYWKSTCTALLLFIKRSSKKNENASVLDVLKVLNFKLADSDCQCDEYEREEKF